LRGYVLATINEIDIMYMDHIMSHLEKENCEYMRQYWQKEMKEYIQIIAKKLLDSDASNS
jgi:hypothetical protein